MSLHAAFSVDSVSAIYPRPISVVHVGPLSTIPENTSPGLSFLRILVPVLDSVGPSPALSTVFAPNATNSTNGATPVSCLSLLPLFALRAQRVKHFSREINRAWELSDPDGMGGCTLFVDWRLTTIFKEDPEDEICVVNKFSVLKLNNKGDGIGLCVAKMESWTDAQMLKKMFGEAWVVG